MATCRVFLFSLISVFLFYTFGTPSSAFAQQRFNPNASIQGGRSFSGIQFSGVGGALASCTNAGGYIASGIGQITGHLNIFGRSMSTLGRNFSSQSVPVSDTVAQAQLQSANQRENCLNGVAYAIAKSLLQQVTNRTLNWVNTGFGGNPLYVRNLDSFLQTVTDEKITRFLDRIPNENPIFGNAIRSIVTEQVSGISDGRIGSVMDTPEGRAYQNFQEDFTNGGWEAFLDPDNNPIDTILQTADRLSSDITTEQESVVKELERNQGFLDLKKCAEYKEQPKTVLYCDEAPPGTTDCVSRSQAQAIHDALPECLRWETTTPGSLIQQRVAEVTSTDIRQLEQADQINEVLGAFFDQLLNRIFSFGLSSVGDRTNPLNGFGGTGSNVVLGTNGQPLSSVAGGTNALGYQNTTGGFNAQDFDVSRPQHIRAVLQAQYDYLSHMQDARVALRRVVPTLGALDYCIPGPNPTWQEGLENNADTFFDSLQTVDKKTSTFTRVLQTIPILGGLFGGGDPDTIAAVDVSLYDKITGEPQEISPIAFRARDHTIPYIFNNVTWRYGELLQAYKDNFTEAKISDAFAAVDSANTAFARGFVADAFDETAQLPAYNQGSIALEAQYSAAEEETQDVIRELEAIQKEADAIVATAKARYIAEQAAAGTPVSRSCIDDAYRLNSSPVVGIPRQESDAPSPFLERSVEAEQYFYSNL